MPSSHFSGRLNIRDMSPTSSESKKRSSIKKVFIKRQRFLPLPFMLDNTQWQSRRGS